MQVLLFRGIFRALFVLEQPQRISLKCVNGARLIKGFNPDIRNYDRFSSMRVFIRRGENKRRLPSSLVIKIDEKSPPVFCSAAQGNTKMHTALGKIESLRVLKNCLVFLILRKIALFRGKCAVSILSVSEERLKIYIAKREKKRVYIFSLSLSLSMKSNKDT